LNHGGPVDDGCRATVDALPEIVKVVGAQCRRLLDSGFRRGTDIVKGLSMGVQAEYAEGLI
jgi:isopentenyl diphosphate isomerase/L-lactate dehydrogenase-like FMN-dependent dehydrogenase